MFDWLSTSVKCVGSILLRGTLPPRPGEFISWSEQGVSAAADRCSENERWALLLNHAEWGQARLVCRRECSPPPPLITECIAGLTTNEHDELRAAGCELWLTMDAQKRQILRDRKLFLRFLAAAMGSDGIAGIDYLARRAWSPVALREELSHDADLDVAQIIGLHSVSEGETVRWLHTHGLAEVGRFDFDILNPTVDLANTAADSVRALAFAILEGELGISTPSFLLASPRGRVRTMPGIEFDRKAAPECVQIRAGSFEAQQRERAIICDPVGRIWGRWSPPRPSSFLSEPIDDDPLCQFTKAATELMGDRARKALAIFREAHEELSEFPFPCLAKLGYQTDGGRPGDKEHLWFEVHGFGVDSIDATLTNRPYAVSRLQEGARGSHDLSLLTDWAILTPFGPITPRSLRALRFIREHKEEVMAAAREQDSDK